MLPVDDMAVQLANDYKLGPQGDTEDDVVFRNRVVGWLRAEGKVIEAHEAQAGRRYDDDRFGDVACGLFGAIGLLFGGMDGRPGGADFYGNNRSDRAGANRLVGDEIAAGMNMGYHPIHAEPVAYAVHDRKADTFS